MIIDEINNRLNYINNKISNSICTFKVINDKKKNIHKIEIENTKNSKILQSYDFGSQKHILQFLDSYHLIDNYIIFINNNYKKV